MMKSSSRANTEGTFYKTSGAVKNNIGIPRNSPTREIEGVVGKISDKVQKIMAGGIVVLVLGICTPVLSANYSIDNPVDRLKNPAGSMYNPATYINNPAANIYNPAAQMDNRNPLSPVTPPVPQATAPIEIPPNLPVGQIRNKSLSQPQSATFHKSYHFKSAKIYILAAKTAFSRDDYVEFLSITEDALRRMSAGTLRASKKTEQKLIKFKIFGYGLL